MNKNKGKGQHIQVYVRVRPLNDFEKRRGSDCIVDCVPNNKEIIVNERPTDKISRKFSFDKVFGPSSKQLDVYKSVACPLIKEVLAGYNCTVFAYGQTGTGKTYTMEGGKLSSEIRTWNTDSHAGIIPRALSHLFDELRLLNVEYSVKASFLEIYNEELFDLLSPVDDTNKLRLFEDSTKKGAVIVNGLDEVAVRNKEEVYSILARGSRKRQTAATLMNAVSSRSHTVFSVTVRIKENAVEDEVLRTGKLNLVDLAGSENIGRSGAVDKRAREAGNINQSLLTLGRVITALVEKTPHIPYRESKLTRLLQESLGGRTKTCIVATVSPSQCNMEETLSTLDYAHRAKNIQNKPEVNEKIGKIALLQEYMEEIHRLKSDLTAAREKSGVYLAEENYNNLMVQIESQKRELSEMLNNLKTATESLDRKEEMNKELTKALEMYREDLNKTRKNLKEIQENLDEQMYLVEHRVRTEQTLSKQAEDLLQVADKATNDTLLLQDTLERKRAVEERNLAACRNTTSVCESKLEDLRSSSSYFEETMLTCSDELKNKLDNMNKQTITNTTQLQEHADYAFKACEESTKIIQDLNEALTSQVSRRADTMLASNAQNFQLHFEMLGIFLKHIGCKLEAVLQFANRSREETQFFTDTLHCKIVEQEQNMLQFLSCSDEQLCKISDDIQKQAVFVDNLNADIARLKNKSANLNENLKAFDEMLQGFRRNAESIDGCIENIESPLADIHLPISNVEDLKSEVVSAKNILQAHANGIQTTINEHQGMNLTSTNEMELVCSELQRVIEEKASNIPANQNELLDCVGEQINSFCKDVSVFKQSVETRVEELTFNLSEFSKSQQKQIQHNTQEQLRFVEECVNHLDSSKESIKLWNNNMVMKANDCEMVLGKFVTEDICADAPSGMTPQRCEYNYPRNLVSTSPHEKILSRMRSAKMTALQQQMIEELGNTHILEAPSLDNSLLSASNSDLGSCTSRSHSDLSAATSDQILSKSESNLLRSNTAGSSQFSRFSENKPEEQGENSRRLRANSVEIQPQKLFSKSESCLPCAMIDKENSAPLPATVGTRSKERRALSEHNE